MEAAQLFLAGRGFNRGQDGNNKARARKSLIGNLTQVGTDKFKFGQLAPTAGSSPTVGVGGSVKSGSTIETNVLMIGLKSY